MDMVALVVPNIQILVEQRMTFLAEVQGKEVHLEVGYDSKWDVARE